MYAINRGVAIIKPKQPFLDWVRALPDPDEHVSRMTLASLRQDCTCILVPERNSDPDGLKFIRENLSWLFERMLEGMWTDENDWPVKRDWKTFREWFEVEFHSVLLDPTDRPVYKEEFD